ncbi:MAG: tetratricopeptide repeat protein [Methanophagales archaeon]|nr:tetratricopeptide repeat protein [Methanophagales archaeon]
MVEKEEKQKERNEDEEENTAEELLIVGEEYLEEGKYEEAIEVYKEIVRKEPRLPTLAKACNDCGAAYVSLEEYEMAIGFFNAALNLCDYLMDEGISTCYNLGLLYRRMGDEEKAEEYFKRGDILKEEHKRRDEEAMRILSAGMEEL